MGNQHEMIQSCGTTLQPSVEQRHLGRDCASVVPDQERIQQRPLEQIVDVLVPSFAAGLERPVSVVF